MKILDFLRPKARPPKMDPSDAIPSDGRMLYQVDPGWHAEDEGPTGNVKSVQAAMITITARIQMAWLFIGLGLAFCVTTAFTSEPLPGGVNYDAVAGILAGLSFILLGVLVHKSASRRHARLNEEYVMFNRRLVSAKFIETDWTMVRREVTSAVLRAQQNAMHKATADWLAFITNGCTEAHVERAMSDLYGIPRMPKGGYVVAELVERQRDDVMLHAARGPIPAPATSHSLIVARLEIMAEDGIVTMQQDELASALGCQSALDLRVWLKSRGIRQQPGQDGYVIAELLERLAAPEDYLEFRGDPAGAVPVSRGTNARMEGG